MPQDERNRMLDALIKINEQWIKTIDDYHFPVVTLSDTTEADALCTIFETLNRTGVKLTVFELLTARFWSQSVRLRELWDEARKRYATIEDFEVDPYYVLQAVSLASRHAPSCKRGDVLKLTAEDINIWWPRVIEGLCDGLTILQDDCKVVTPKWLPYQTMLVPLAAVLARSGLRKTPEAGARREKLKRWFWCGVFGQAYDSSANSQSAKDMGELVGWLSGGPSPETVKAFRFDPRLLRDTTPRQRAIYRGTICLILGSANGARDFHTQAVITGKLMQEQGIDDHHIFPAKFLERSGVTQSRVRDCVLNRTLIDRTTNQIIGDRAPSDYLARISNTPGFPLDAVLASHCLPVGTNSPLFKDDFESFLAWREELLWERIRQVTGVMEAADLEAEETELA